MPNRNQASESERFTHSTVTAPHNYNAAQVEKFRSVEAISSRASGFRMFRVRCSRTKEGLGPRRFSIIGGVPAGILADFPAGIPALLPAVIPAGIPRGILAGIPAGIPAGNPAGILAGMPAIQTNTEDK